MERYLVLKFKTDVDGVKYTLQVKDVQERLTTEIKPAITAIIAANCIKYKNARLVECISAEIVNKNVTEISLV